MYQALYRKYRPTTFEEVVGQKVIIKTLTNTIINDKINHAYLFTGPRGTGKTSVAKILAKIVNCEHLNGINPCNECVSCNQINNKQNTDIIEIDAASNNGVDEIRELRDKVNLVPSYGKYKVYIIDEVHMLTTAAFNALLKTLEEPPKHIIFILATTEPYKIPATILSRCQRFDFKKIGMNDIISKLKFVCEKEKIEIDDDAISLIAKLSDGGMRDSLSLLDQLSAYSNDRITLSDVNEVSGVLTLQEMFELINHLCDKDLNGAFNLIDSYDNEGKNLSKIIEFIIDLLKNSLIYLNSSDYFNDNEEKQIYENVCKKMNENQIYKCIDIFLEVLKSVKNTNNTKLIFELAFIKIIQTFNTKLEQKEIEIPMYEEKKKISTQVKYEEKKVSNGTKSEIEKLKKLRINNTLSKFDKKELLAFKEEFDKIKEKLMDPDYSSVVSLILDGELKAKGDENLLFVYKLKNLEDLFNQSLIEIQNVLLKTFNIEYKPIAVTSDEWDPIKLDFNKSIKSKSKKYEYVNETKSLDEIYGINESDEVSDKNEIEEIFEDIIVYN